MRVVVKIGTNVVASPNKTVNRPRLLEVVRQLAHLQSEGHHLVLVSSGAVFVGRQFVPDLSNRKDIPFKQMLAAIGQVKLMHIYEQLFGIYGIVIAQALLTRSDIKNRTGYLNARNTLNLLLEQGIIPIINENDVVGVEEIKIGDNDNLSALIANLIDADLLLMLTDQPGLFTADPRANANAELISEVSVITEAIYALAGGTATQMGTGGMSTKIQAAQLATRSGVETIIASGHEPNVISRIISSGEALGTRFPAPLSHIESRKRWLLAEAVQGTLTVDAGAARALVKHQRSLLPAGITAVAGDFPRGSIVVVQGADGQRLCRGITSYKAADIQRIKGHHSEEIDELLGFNYGPNVIHRDNLVVL